MNKSSGFKKGPVGTHEFWCCKMYVMVRSRRVYLGLPV